MDTNDTQSTSPVVTTEAIDADEEHQAPAWQRDFVASIVVVLVALPLCIGIAKASGLPPISGVITGIIGGIIVGLLAGSPLQVSGPAAGLFVVVLNFISEIRTEFILKVLKLKYGLKATVTAIPDEAAMLELGLTKEAITQLNGDALAEAIIHLGAMVFLAGILQIVAGVLKLGRWFRAISPAVVNGMLAGIGILIFLNQFHYMVDSGIQASPLTHLLEIPTSIQNAFVGTEQHKFAALLGCLTILALVLWDAFKPKMLKTIPGTLVGVVLASGLAFALGLRTVEGGASGIDFVKLDTNLAHAVTIPVWSFDLARWGRAMTHPAVLTGTIELAVIASAVSLLVATAVDQLHSGKRAKHDKELIAQGVGNIFCGLLGVMPLNGVIVRSSANIDAGATSRWSTVLHGFWVLALLLFFPELLTYIPSAALAAILVYTGYRLVWKPAVVKELAKYGTGEVAIFFATIATNLLKGIFVGFTLATIRLLYIISHLRTWTEELPDGSKIVHLQGAGTFLSLPVLASALEKLDLSGRYTIMLRDLEYVDHACLELIANWEKQVEISGGSVTLEWEVLAQRFHKRTDSGRIIMDDFIPGRARVKK